MASKWIIITGAVIGVVVTAAILMLLLPAMKEGHISLSLKPPRSISTNLSISLSLPSSTAKQEAAKEPTAEAEESWNETTTPSTKHHIHHFFEKLNATVVQPIMSRAGDYVGAMAEKAASTTPSSSRPGFDELLKYQIGGDSLILPATSRLPQKIPVTYTDFNVTIRPFLPSASFSNFGLLGPVFMASRATTTPVPTKPGEEFIRTTPFFEGSEIEPLRVTTTPKPSANELPGLDVRPRISKRGFGN